MREAAARRTPPICFGSEGAARVLNAAVIRGRGSIAIEVGNVYLVAEAGAQDPPTLWSIESEEGPLEGNDMVWVSRDTARIILHGLFCMKVQEKTDDQ